jgi:hypothetical protein
VVEILLKTDSTYPHVKQIEELAEQLQQVIDNYPEVDVKAHLDEILERPQPKPMSFDEMMRYAFMILQGEIVQKHGFRL